MTFSTFASPGVSLQGSSETASLPISGNGATVTASTPLVDGTQTWNNAAVVFTGLKFNANDTASSASSLLIDLQTNAGSAATSQFKVRKDGVVIAGQYTGVSNSAALIDGLAPSLGVNLANACGVAWSSGASYFNAKDLFLTRRGAANLRLGTVDAAAPVAQTLSVQSVVAGTSNTAGTSLTITGSQSTGSGAGGSIVFETAAANSGGGATVQNTLATAMVIDSVKTVRLGTGYTVATLPAAGTAGRRTYVTDATAPTFLGVLIGGGAVVCPVFDNGTAWVSA
jgi:hypothetical protein